MKHDLKMGLLIMLSLTLLHVAAYAETAAGGDQAIDSGKTVKMHFTMKSEGKVIETTEGKEPFQFTFGKNPIIPGLDEALKGMKAGEKKRVSLAPEKAFGHIDSKAIVDFPRDQFKEKDIKTGMMFVGKNKAGLPLRGIVKDVNKDKVTLDFNHPLAGKAVDLDLEIVEVA